jgi:hypothetical protein
MWIIQEPKKVALWNKRHFEEKNEECVACLKYSVLTFVEKIYKMQHLESSGTPVLYIGRTVLKGSHCPPRGLLPTIYLVVCLLICSYFLPYNYAAFRGAIGICTSLLSHRGQWGKFLFCSESPLLYTDPCVCLCHTCVAWAVSNVATVHFTFNPYPANVEYRVSS